MSVRLRTFLAFAAAFLFASPAAPLRAQQSSTLTVSTRCLVCHNNLNSSKGQDVSIGKLWSTSLMANSARDPYWQGSVRRETLDHPAASAAIQTECATCHMPIQFQADKAAGHDTAVFSTIPFSAHHNAEAADGVSCAVCHEAQPSGLGTPASYNGNLSYAPPAGAQAELYGPYAASARALAIHKAVTSLTTTESNHLSQSGLCGSCHTLYTTTLGADGKPAGKFPEQMVYLEWQHSDYNEKQTCQSCHMPAVGDPAPVATLGSPMHNDVRLHTFTGANFFMQAVLNEHHDELSVTATPTDFTKAIDDTRVFLQSKAAKLSISAPSVASGKLSFAVTVQNLTGHKLPTAFPSRRAWLHVVVTDASGKTVFESGKLNANGSIAGNANDADPTKYSPHYTTITSPDEVEIFEPILGDKENHVTTALLTATHYLKDNRILPAGFDKKTASDDIAVRGKAADDAAFAGGTATTHYEVPAASAGPFQVKVELMYQPIGYRWAQNLAPYKADETQRFVSYFNKAAGSSAIDLAHADVTAK
ncbi:MAG TPA: hypothetical protein VG844_01515 [Terracidiphilus sp.]|nr:hypothetical protein [Terracidiphilus sp.]